MVIVKSEPSWATAFESQQLDVKNSSYFRNIWLLGSSSSRQVSSNESPRPAIYHLDYWEEHMGGRLKRLDEDGETLFAVVGKVTLVLPLNLANRLRPHMGKRLAILRTDLPDKPYLFRIIPESESDNDGN